MMAVTKAWMNATEQFASPRNWIRQERRVRNARVSFGFGNWMTQQGKHHWIDLGCPPLAVRMTALKAGLGRLLPSNKSGFPLARQEFASFTPQNVTIFTESRC